ncbi:hypothetical protein [Streptomyces sp. TE33382]
MEFPIKVALAKAVPELPRGPGWWTSRSSTVLQTLACVSYGAKEVRKGEAQTQGT